MSDQNLSVLFSTLDAARKQTTINEKFIISELTLVQQRELSVTIFDPLETPAKLGIAFNNIIKDCTKVLNGSFSDITVLDRAPLIRELRDLSVGKTFTKTIINDEKEEEIVKYTFKPINYKKIYKIKLNHTLDINANIKILLSVPSLDKDTATNKLLLQTINSYKHTLDLKRDKLDKGFITSQYITFELLKFIDSIFIGEDEFKFKDLTSNEQIRVINSLSHEYINQITDFIHTIKNTEEIVFTAINEKTKEEEVIALEYNIFSKEL